MTFLVSAGAVDWIRRNVFKDGTKLTGTSLTFVNSHDLDFLSASQLQAILRAIQDATTFAFPFPKNRKKELVKNVHLAFSDRQVCQVLRILDFPPQTVQPYGAMLPYGGVPPPPWMNPMMMNPIMNPLMMNLHAMNNAAVPSRTMPPFLAVAPTTGTAPVPAAAPPVSVPAAEVTSTIRNRQRNKAPTPTPSTSISSPNERRENSSKKRRRQPGTPNAEQCVNKVRERSQPSNQHVQRLNKSIRVKTEPEQGFSSTSTRQLPSPLQSQNDPRWESEPRNIQERNMLHSLREMGFTDTREMLGGIRHVLQRSQSSQVDEAMMWIVSQREEAEEARKMDATRRESELLRKEAAAKRAKSKAAMIENATMEQWTSQPDLFRGSVVLNYASKTLQRVKGYGGNDKQILVKFLELEKKALKWYGIVLPWCYLKELAFSWNRTKKKAKLREAILDSIQQMERGMYVLEEQECQVPRIFRQAQRDAEAKGQPTRPNELTSSLDDENEVLIVTPSCSNSSSSSPSPKEIVEIL